MVETSYIKSVQGNLLNLNFQFLVDYLLPKDKLFKNIIKKILIAR